MNGSESVAERYRDVTEWLFGQLAVFQHIGASAYKPGLDTALRLSAMFGNPHLKLRTIHVAGTNGKGSTSSTLASILQAAGYRTGLYTSPHLVDFRERIRVDGHMISREEVIDFTERYLAMDSGMKVKPSFFELTTIMAFEHFVRNDVDIAVIETGLGGRLDTTNIIIPCMSVITNISYDHTALLGETLEAIAGEKAGIIKHGIPVVVGEAEGAVRRVFELKAESEDAPVIFAGDYAPVIFSADDGYKMVYITRGHGIIYGSLRGECQPLNAATVLTAVDMLNARCMMRISDSALKRGFARVEEATGLTGRWTVVEGSPMVIYDTGHNIGGWIHIAADLARLPGHKILVIGFVSDKDVTSILDLIREIPDCEVIFTRASVARALDGVELCRLAASRGLTGDVISGVSEAVAEACRRAVESKATVFVGGSNFVVGDYLASIAKKQ